MLHGIATLKLIKSLIFTATLIKALHSFNKSQNETIIVFPSGPIQWCLWIYAKIIFSPILYNITVVNFVTALFVIRLRFVTEKNENVQCSKYNYSAICEKLRYFPNHFRVNIMCTTFTTMTRDDLQYGRTTSVIVSTTQSERISLSDYQVCLTSLFFDDVIPCVILHFVIKTVF